MTEAPEAGSGAPPWSLDQPFHAGLARLTGGLSPLALRMAFADWAEHLALSPDKQVALALAAGRLGQELAAAGMGSVRRLAGAPAPPAAADRRFAGPAWQAWPFDLMAQSFLATEAWWRGATTDVPGVGRHHTDIVSFAVRQALDMLAPTNLPWTNPEVIAATAREGGMNFVRGALHALEDAQRQLAGRPPAGAGAFAVGRNLAVTPGKVVLRNRLIELIQYAPTTDRVRPEPILIVPAWIMKYYILDLSAENSLVRWLVARGHTVFVISWKNPGATEHDLGMDDYRRLGVMAALDAVRAIVPEAPVHAVGYCLGGTLLAIAAAAMGRDDARRLASLTLFAAQTDFTEAGELTLFIDEDQVRFLESMMEERGYLDARQMAGAFQLLRSNDLIWSAMVRGYLLGEREPLIDLMAWNADTTRMPARMHSEYLRRLFLRNDLTEGRFAVDGRPVSLRDIRVPVFAVSTVTDHVAPWRSVYKIQMLTDADVTFVLSNGGHNAGIVNPPGNPHRHHQIATHRESEPYIDPDAWQGRADRHQGSWWPCWGDWLARHSGAAIGALPPMGAPERAFVPVADAPGTYVLER